ncbi:hypothetical protein FH972_001640 [Carpinus fangiana]|uniref:3-methyl-2-oxobutanoate hydroxymethyltransferase n=1 Tax=Carpinus fangiana TaxID=176857 RepID=A0A5N6QF08_9ROSI|nr:hypothetical protein FH972_001640 [Carpinus fangiana]
MEASTRMLLSRAGRLVPRGQPILFSSSPSACNDTSAKQYRHNHSLALAGQASRRPYLPQSSTSTRSIQPDTHSRASSHSPMAPSSPTTPPRKKVTLHTIDALYRRNEPITMITAHDFPSAHVADQNGMDMVLVGDSLAMVALGMEDTSAVLEEEMLLHCRSVARGAPTAFLVGDLPMGSYEISPAQALTTAIRFIKHGRMHAVKLEGGAAMAPTVAAVVRAGIPVLAHVGLTPQRQNALGGFRVQGRTAAAALQVLADARAVEAAGAFAVVLEAVPAEVAAYVTRRIGIPTIGIGAGAGCSGQVLVQVDMSGNFPPGRFLPKFVKKYGDVWGEASRAIAQYRDEVKSRAYPAKEHTYPMKKEEVEEFERLTALLDDAEAKAEREFPES